MKKAKKLLALISLAVMIASIGAMSVSAGIADNKMYYVTHILPDGSTEPCQVIEKLIYTGIVVTMPENQEPTNDLIGLDCDIKEYNAVNYGAIEKLNIIGSDSWFFEETVELEENQFVLDTEELITEEEAIEFANKLVIRGIVEKADILYNHVVSNGYMKVDEDEVWIGISFNDEESADNFDFENYPEIKTYLKFTDYDFEVKENIWGEQNIKINCSTNNSSYIDSESGLLDKMQINNDVISLNELLKEKYSNINRIESLFCFLYTDDNSVNASYSILPKWGDATNDDKVDLYDAIEIAKYIMDISEFDEDTKLLADINRDGVTDLYDAIEIARIIMEESKAE